MPLLFSIYLLTHNFVLRALQWLLGSELQCHLHICSIICQVYLVFQYLERSAHLRKVVRNTFYNCPNLSCPNGSIGIKLRFVGSFITCQVCNWLRVCFSWAINRYVYVLCAQTFCCWSCVRTWVCNVWFCSLFTCWKHEDWWLNVYS